MTPIFRVTVDSTDITRVVAERLVYIRVVDRAGWKADNVEIQLDDSGGLIELPRKGAMLTVSLGFIESGLVEAGQYTVDEIGLSGVPDVMTIRGRAVGFLGGKHAPKTRKWESTTLGGIVTTIAKEHGLTPRTGKGLADVKIACLAQTNESDLHLLTRLGQQYGAVAKPAYGHLLFVKQGEAKRASGGLMPVFPLVRGDLTEWDFVLPSCNKYAAVKAEWHDLNAAKRDSVTVGEGKPVFPIRQTFLNREEAARSAAAKLDALQRSAGVGEMGMAIGNPAIGAESKVALSGMREGLDTEWLVTEATHTLDGSGLVTQVSVELPKTAATKN